MKYGPCPKCAGDMFDFEPIEIEPLPLLNIGIATDNYCSKCGKALWQTCFACNGTGKSVDLGIDVSPIFCSECGRALKKKRKKTRCSSCAGRGKIRSPHMCIR